MPEVKSQKSVVDKLTDVKEKLSFLKDTCCFSSTPVDFDEIDEMTRDIEYAISFVYEKCQEE